MMAATTFSRRAGLPVAALALAMAAACSQPATPDTSVKPLSIGVIPKGTTHEFWNAIHAGAVKAERELTRPSRYITWKGRAEDDR